MYAPSRKILCHPLQTLSSITHAASARMKLLPRGKRNTIDRIGIEVFMVRLVQQRKTGRRCKGWSPILSRLHGEALVLRRGSRRAYKIGQHGSKFRRWMVLDTGPHL